MKLAACQMQPTGEAWLGEIPAAWNFKRLKYCVRAVTEKVDKTPDDRSYVGLESVESGTGRLANRETPLTAEGGVSLFERDDVLFGKLRPYLAKAWHATTAGACTSELLVMRPKLLESRYLLYSVLNPSFIQAVNGSTYGAQMPRASWDFIGNLPQPFPPTAEQKRIAAFLDAKLGRLDELMRKKERQLALLTEKRQALISQAVTRGLNLDAPTKNTGIEWLGNIPAHWQAKRIKYCFHFLDHRRIPLSSEERSLRQGPYPYYGASGIIDSIDEFLFDEPLILFGEDGANLVCQSTPLAFVATGKYWVNNHAHILKPKFGALSYWERTLNLLDVRPSVTGSAQPKLTAEALGNIAIPAPPTEEQIQIGNHLTAIETAMQNPAQKIKAQLAKFHEYRQALITAAVTGQVAIPEEFA